MSVYRKKTDTKPRLVDRKGRDIAEGYSFKPAKRSGNLVTAGSQSSLLPQKGSKLVGADGEYNAYSKKDLKEIVAGLNMMADRGELTLDTGIRRTVDEASNRWSQEGHLVKAALEDRFPSDGGAFHVLGEVFTDQIAETMGRLGFTNKVLAQQDVPEQGTARVRIRQKDVVSWIMMADGHTAESKVRQRYIYPKGYDITALIMIYEADIYEAGSAIIEEKYNDALEQTMVRDDNITKFLLDQAAPTANDVIAFNAFTPNVFAELRDQVWRWSLPVPHALMSRDLWVDLFADSDWQRWYSPIEKHEYAVEGKLGKLGDVEIITDGFVYDTLKVLDPGEIYFLSAPATLGMKSNMVPLQSEMVNQRLLGRPARGWFLYLRQATILANSRGVSKGTKIS